MPSASARSSIANGPDESVIASVCRRSVFARSTKALRVLPLDARVCATS